MQDELRHVVAEFQHLGAGVFGADDVRLRLDALEVLFCHDSDVHVFYDDQRSSLVLDWANRWSTPGYTRSFWRRDAKTGVMRRTTPDGQLGRV